MDWRNEGTVNQQCRARAPRRFVAGEEQRHTRDIVRLAGAANRLRLGQSPLATFCRRTPDRSVDTAGTDAIDADAIFTQFDRRTLSEVDYTGLGRAVNRWAKPSLHSRDRSGGDDRATARLAHLGNRIL